MKIFWKAYAWTLVILYLSLSPKENFPKVSVINFDKFVHLMMYLVLTFLFVVAFFKKFPTNPKTYYLFPLMIGLFVGGGTELAQSIEFINRKADWLDMISNSLGAILAVVIFYYLNKKSHALILKWL